MDWLGRILFSRVCIDKRTEKHWYYSGIKSLDMVCDIVPIFISLALMMKMFKLILKDKPKNDGTTMLKPKKVSKLKLWRDKMWWGVQRRWYEFNKYWFGEVL